jgi:hypothetical protein
VITGINTHLEHGGTDYHIQIEDIAPSAELEVRVYAGGRILFHKRHSYRQVVEGLANPTHIQTAVKDELGKLLGLVKAAIERGRIKA